MNIELVGKGLLVLFVAILFASLSSPTIHASPDSISISINPDNPLIYAGETESVKIKVTNQSGSTDNYTLTVIDDAGWDLKLQENRWEGVGPGEQRTTMLSITVPKDVKIGFQENITVIVLSSTGIEENGTIKVGVLRGDITNWGYVTTGAGVIVIVIVIVLVLWKGGI